MRSDSWRRGRIARACRRTQRGALDQLGAVRRQDRVVADEAAQTHRDRDDDPTASQRGGFGHIFVVRAEGQADVKGFGQNDAMGCAGEL